MEPLGTPKSLNIMPQLNKVLLKLQFRLNSQQQMLNQLPPKDLLKTLRMFNSPQM
jgi:hypothetical protein